MTVTNMTVKCLVLFLLLLISLTGILGIRVCKTFLSYYLDKGGLCSDNPNPDLSQAEIIEKWGFKAEIYELTTEDGYIINLIRGYRKIKSNLPPIVFGHGIVSNGYTWVSRDKKTLPYILGNRGHEFWIVNWRGTKMSRGHSNMSDSEKSYWKFSFHEVAVYDLKAVLEKVFETTNKKAIYIGMSMGTTISFIFASLHPDLADSRLSKIISLAPVAYLNNIPSILRFAVPFLNVLENVISQNGQALPAFEIPIQKHMCANAPHQMFFCEVLKGLVFGTNFDQMDPLTLPVTESLNYDSSSWGMIEHYAEIITTKRFIHYNNGERRNIVRYDQLQPPSYPIKNITVPITFFVGQNDYLATVENTKRFYSELNKTIRCGYHVITDKNWDHGNFLEGKDIKTLLYPMVLSAIKANVNDICTEDL